MAGMRAQKSMSGNNLSFNIDMDSVLEAIGAGEALVEAMNKRSPYVDALVDAAFEQADDVFNIQAAAYASTGAISHMYEWGTVGVNRGRTNIRMQPTNPNARLWHTFNTGAGLDRVITYAFRPSVANVPKPTRAETGMSNEVIKLMRDHVFRWKARMMERNEIATIRPNKAKFLLIPAYEENRPYMRPNDIKRGYTLSKGPLFINPGGSHYRGEFTAFWYNFWENRGAELIDENLEKLITSDFTPEFEIKRTASTMTPIGQMNTRTKIDKAKKKTLSRVNQKAKLRGISSREGSTGR